MNPETGDKTRISCVALRAISFENLTKTKTDINPEGEKKVALLI
jgi:hypothetical protein